MTDFAVFEQNTEGVFYRKKKFYICWRGYLVRVARMKRVLSAKNNGQMRNQ